MAPAAGESTQRLGLGEAEMIALSTVILDHSSYRHRLVCKEVVWYIKEAIQSWGYYRITSAFREADSIEGEVGEEELYIDQQGNVRVRQVRHWPSGSSRRAPLLLPGIGIFLIVASVVGVGVFALH